MTERYIEWDYETGHATEYQRTGECNRCGECCRGEITFRFIKATAAEPNSLCKIRGGSEFAGPDGQWQEVDVDGVRIIRQLASITPGVPVCGALTADLCSVHEDDQPGVCALWPVAPCDIVAFPHCGYAFKVISEWKFNHE